MLEQGMLPLDATNAKQLASALSVPISLLLRAADATAPSIVSPNRGLLALGSSLRWLALVLLLAILLVGASLMVAWLGVSPVRQVDASVARRPARAVATFITATALQLEPTSVVTQTPVPLATPLPTLGATASPTTTPAPDGSPRACPLLAEPQRVVITQGYGEGTHQPINTSGAIDLAIDADGDGNAEPDATGGVVILATQSGIARVWLGSWPGGNVIRIVDEQTGWNTLYAHLAEVTVSDGQPVTVGMPLGTVGSTGMSTGPHLHYEIWHYGENRDPTAMAPCWL
jgi:murein DD-endopeptidase MepM/ murein hydrolase activator NlpD